MQNTEHRVNNELRLFELYIESGVSIRFRRSSAVLTQLHCCGASAETRQEHVHGISHSMMRSPNRSLRRLAYRPDDLIPARLGPRCTGCALELPIRESEPTGAVTTSFVGDSVASNFC
jgi:hypothetical protein